MPNLNAIHIIGNLTREPDLKYLPNGTAVCEFGIAVNRTYTVNGEKREEVTFLECVTFARTAEIVGEYAKKGRPIYVGGYIRQENWDDKTTGQKRSKLKVIGDNIQLLGGRNDDDRGQQGEHQESQQEAPPPVKKPLFTPPAKKPPIDDDLDLGLGETEPPF